MKTIKGALKKIQSWTNKSQVEKIFLIGLKHYEPVIIQKIATGDGNRVSIKSYDLRDTVKRLINLYGIDSVVMVHNHPISDESAFEGYPSICDMFTSNRKRNIIEDTGIFYDGDYVVSSDGIYKYDDTYENIKSITPIKIIGSDDFKISIISYDEEIGIHILNIAEKLYQKIPDISEEF